MHTSLHVLCCLIRYPAMSFTSFSSSKCKRTIIGKRGCSNQWLKLCARPNAHIAGQKAVLRYAYWFEVSSCITMQLLCNICGRGVNLNITLWPNQHQPFLRRTLIPNGKVSDLSGDKGKKVNIVNSDTFFK